jgi:hypothetical protein
MGIDAAVRVAPIKRSKAVVKQRLTARLRRVALAQWAAQRGRDGPKSLWWSNLFKRALTSRASRHELAKVELRR